MSVIFSRNSRHLKKYLVIGAHSLLRIYSNNTLSNQHMVFPFNTYSEVTLTLRETIGHFALRAPKINYQYSDPIQLYKEQKQGVTVNHPVTIVVFDVGTTGLDSTKNQITDIAMRDLKGGVNSMFHMFVNPDIPLKNHKTNQILTTSSELSCGLTSLVKWIKSRQKDSKLVILVAHNGHRFDFPFLVKAFHQNGVDIPDDWLFLDTLPIARQLYYPDGTKVEKGNHKLYDIVTFFAVNVKASAYKSAADVNALSSVLQQMTFFFNLTDTDLIKRAYIPSRYSVRPQY